MRRAQLRYDREVAGNARALTQTYAIPDLARLERERDVTFHRTAGRRVRGEASATRFIEEVGFCTAFSRRINVPCLWVAICGRRDPRMPVHTHHDEGIGLTWQLKDSLPEKKLVYYARVLRRLPTLISLEYLPSFYRLFAPMFEDDGRAPLPARRVPSGAVSLPARGILDRLRTHPSQSTAQLRMQAYCGERALSKPAFEKAIAELQQKFLVVRTEAQYEPKFTYIWDLFERQFPAAARSAERLTRDQALDRILGKYFSVVRYARPADVHSLFGLHSVETHRALKRLTAAGMVHGPADLPGRAGKHWLAV
jgi:hypothetical protein